MHLSDPLYNQKHITTKGEIFLKNMKRKLNSKNWNLLLRVASVQLILNFGVSKHRNNKLTVESFYSIAVFLIKIGL